MDTTFQSIANKYLSTLFDYKPFADKSTNTSQNDIPKEVLSLIRDVAAEYYQKPYPQLLATDYMRLSRNGNRSEFENAYFEKRHKLNALVAAEYYGVNIADILLDAVIDGIWSVCEESSWCLPAHNTYKRDTPQIILPDSDNPVMDLFACETGATLAMTYYLLKDRLDKISPLICERIYKEIEKRIITPFIYNHFWWMGDGKEPMNNWTVWCIQNTLLCAFLLPYAESDRRRIFDKACFGIDCFLADYGEDGCCDEGAHYYRHAGLCLFGCIEILNAVTAGAFSQLSANVKITNIADYIVIVHIGGPYYVNYADSLAKPGYCGIREFLFGELCKLPDLILLASEDYKESLDTGKLFEDESVKLNLYYRIETIHYAKKILDVRSSSIKSINIGDSENNVSCFNNDVSSSDKDASRLNNMRNITRDIFYESVGLGILRSKDFTLSVKAGDNDDSHNHNDTGSIILFKGLDPIFIDIGPETYSKKTFSPQRYEIWTMQSSYHNLPTLGGLDELPGCDFMSTNLDVDLDAKTISMDINDAFPTMNYKDTPAACALRYNRKVTVDESNEVVTLTDTASVSPADIQNGIILNFITYHKPAVNEADKTIKIGSADIRYEGADLYVVETLPITDERLMKSWDHDLYRIRLNMNAKTFCMTVR